MYGDRGRRHPASLSYDDPPRRPNRQEVSTTAQDLPRDARYVPSEDAVAQQNRVFEVVAQITQQAKEARERKPIKQEPMGGSEDGELRAVPSTDEARVLPTEASSAAERFLNEMQPGERAESAKIGDVERKEGRLSRGARDSMQRTYQPLEEPRRVRDSYEEDGRRGRTVVEDGAGYIIRERAPLPRESPAYAYDDRYVSAAPEQAIARERSPELVDRRFKLNNVVYRDERPNGGTRRTPSQYARYESVRLENDRARSRSPVYVKVGAQPGQYRERSPAHFPEAVYGSRAPAQENVAYERAPRQEYYRVYADEPRRPEYVEAFEYVQVSDPQGDYMIRRPVRREREDPVYAYGDEPYARPPVYDDRPPVYETRQPVSRADPAYYEEYDPRNPAPPPPPAAAPARPRYLD